MSKNKKTELSKLLKVREQMELDLNFLQQEILTLQQKDEDKENSNPDMECHPDAEMAGVRWILMPWITWLESYYDLRQETAYCLDERVNYKLLSKQEREAIEKFTTFGLSNISHEINKIIKSLRKLYIGENGVELYGAYGKKHADIMKIDFPF